MFICSLGHLGSHFVVTAVCRSKILFLENPRVDIEIYILYILLYYYVYIYILIVTSVIVPASFSAAEKPFGVTWVAIHLMQVSLGPWESGSPENWV